MSINPALANFALASAPASSNTSVKLILSSVSESMIVSLTVSKTSAIDPQSISKNKLDLFGASNNAVTSDRFCLA